MREGPIWIEVTTKQRVFEAFYPPLLSLWHKAPTAVLQVLALYLVAFLWLLKMLRRGLKDV
jgi:hypothetical protein